MLLIINIKTKTNNSCTLKEREKKMLSKAPKAIPMALGFSLTYRHFASFTRLLLVLWLNTTKITIITIIVK